MLAMESGFGAVNSFLLLFVSPCTGSLHRGGKIGRMFGQNTENRGTFFEDYRYLLVVVVNVWFRNEFVDVLFDHLNIFKRSAPIYLVRQALPSADSPEGGDVLKPVS